MDDEVRAALAAADDPSALPQDRAEMLIEIAMGPKSPDETEAAIDLYERASAICPTGEHLLSTRIASRLATALLALPIGGADPLERARTELEKATRYRPEQGAHHRCHLGLPASACTASASSIFARLSVKGMDRKAVARLFCRMANSFGNLTRSKVRNVRGRTEDRQPDRSSHRIRNAAE
ncbi:hypothetical protein [Mesorhizobium sp.]|uniref:hypothetical protein n=1 Tax=Mesorhizobium sp. TaxID=1871066 RepID=UPI0025C191C9|nr:hypothetical protein [Mesorhizobium sp.]